VIPEPEPYNGKAVCYFDDAGNVQIKANATTDPKRIGGIKAWDARVEATWEVAQAKFISQKVKDYSPACARAEPERPRLISGSVRK
jgi:hypothetical protein